MACSGLHPLSSHSALEFLVRVGAWCQLPAWVCSDPYLGGVVPQLGLPWALPIVSSQPDDPPKPHSVDLNSPLCRPSTSAHIFCPDLLFPACYQGSLYLKPMGWGCPSRRLCLGGGCCSETQGGCSQAERGRDQKHSQTLHSCHVTASQLPGPREGDHFPWLCLNLPSAVAK